LAGNTFRCRLVTPTASLLDEQVVYASVPAWDGLFGVMPQRAPILAKLGLGELRLDFPEDAKKGTGGSRSFVVEGGFARMAAGELTILAERATPAESLTDAETALELKQVEERIRALPSGAPDRLERLATLDAARRAALLKQRVAREKKGI
jgi:F-type H+-transporting ATPase subunit epsilon